MDVGTMLQSQHEIYGRISRSVENLKKMGSSSINLSAIETRIKIADQLWTKFEAQHDQIRAAYKDKFNDSEYARSNLFDTAENTYVIQRSTLAEYATQYRVVQVAPTPPNEHGSDRTSKTSLPRIKLPQFSGAYADWPSFRDLFMSVIGENASISDVERFHYLRSCLQGQAEKLIRPLTVTGENYERAWAILSKHFENKRELIRANFATFTAVSKMKGETAEELSRIYHAVTTAVNGQESIGRPIDSNGMDLFNHLVIELFDPCTRLEWESSTCDSAEPPDHETLLDFITKRMLTLNAAKPKSTKVSGEPSRTAKTHFTKHGFDNSRCALCKEKHSVMTCAQFKTKSANERKSFVEASKLCYNCLGNHPVAKCQSSKNCWTCKARHHSMLHDAYVTPQNNEVSALSAVKHAEDRKAVLLATARVLVADRFGELHTVRALIDQGSEVSLVSEALVQQLRLRRSNSSVSIIGIGGSLSGAARGKVTLSLTSKVTGAKLSAVAYVLPRLSSYRGATTTRRSHWTHTKDLPLADPEYQSNDQVDLLLGAEICSVIFEDGIRKGGAQAPIAQKTTLGWILSGGCGVTSHHTLRGSFQCTVDDELASLVRRFWEQEALPPAPTVLTPEENQCEEFFVRTHERTATGRYQVRLPFTATPLDLAETRKPAERLLVAMERKGVQDPQFGNLYRTFMQEYADLKHMELVPEPAVVNGKTRCYLPHHGVLRESSTTTKLRVVFNGSQRTRSGESLNNQLLVGANLLPSLADVLLRWRWHRYVIVADIEKMYRQILLHPNDRDFQRVLWRQAHTDCISEFRLNTVTYGLACAPFLAIRTLRQLADDEELRFPRGAAALRKDCYVDDVVTGANTMLDATALQRELRDLCMAGGFPLRKWASNCNDVLAGIPLEHRIQKTQHSWENESHSTLGLRWHPRDDQFAFSIQPSVVADFTKRRVLAETARLFDPSGWLAPVIIRAKILIQSAWIQGLEWDAPLPSADALLWRHFLEELPQLEHIRLNRWLRTGSEDSHVELHGFADASERGYAAVVYLRTSTSSSTSIHLIAAKSKIAPLKQVTLPRLELCAASLLTNITHHIRASLNLPTAPVYLWSDSTVALHWIHGHASRWKTYVANRISQIQLLLPEARWRHVPGKENPADCASRGISPRELVSHSLWWTGPAWLRKDKESWPDRHLDVDDNKLPERRATSNVAEVFKEPELLLQFSSLQRLLRVTAWCFRWKRRITCRHPPKDTSPILQPDELDDALFQWLRVVQSLHYAAEIANISSNRAVSHQSSLKNLNPFLDDKQVLRVGGRLKHAILSQDERHPMIVPPASWLTRLIVDSCHRRTLHGGVQLTLGLIRLRFWIPRGRAIVKQALHRCVTCTRWRAAVPQPMMGHLPQGRVTPGRPFLHTGVDYAGPIRIRTTKGRGHKAYKGFIAVFVCLCSRAVHLEAVSDYTTDAFLAALRRFTARRGLCSDIYSDCGTNFVGADRELRSLFRASSPDGHRIAQATSTNGIRWHFNPPAAPHFGGLWEAAVKSTKHHLRRVIGETTLTYEELSTFLTQVEACLNSRPLQALSDDPDDFSALTPGHLLIGAPLLAVPEPSLLSKGETTLSRWQLIQRMRDHFWERWSREYLHGLTARPKWWKTKESPGVGTLCLLRSETTPPNRWPLARITKLHPGQDGVTRVVTIRTPTSEFVRPLIKLVLLPGTADALPPDERSAISAAEY
ncbi:bel12-ag transposon polyprotein [Lasius niger]|uniref:Bel12-ag transposon polyprotein n=1 Tax=Lasius niger TaxID=67767 RepID=A0A0J7KCI2_LASNI|nr:bel12-ag transposon polyprotein [Lasius niger]